MSDNDNGMVANPFANDEPAHKTSMEVVESSRSIAETQATMIIARRFPRDQQKAVDRIVQACTRPQLADVAIYAYPRGGTQVTGPSIRLAEAIAQNWGNLQFGIRELSQEHGRSSVQAYAWDIETNTRAEKVFEVKHERYTKKGTYPLTDPRDIYELVANNGARRVRACILALIPGDVIESAVAQCEATQKAAMGAPEAKIKSMIESFAKYGVTKRQLEKRLQHRLDADTTVVAELLSLHKIYVSLKDGYTKPDEWFEPDIPDPADKTSAKSKLKKAAEEIATAQTAVKNSDAGADAAFEGKVDPELEIF